MKHQFAPAVMAGVTVLLGCSGSPDALNPLSPPPAASSRAIHGYAGDVIPGEYIVRFAAGVTDARGLSSALARQYRGKSIAVWNHALNGMAIRLPDSLASRLSRDPRVVSFEPNRTVTTTDVQYDAPWGLDRIDQADLPLSGSYAWNGVDGSGVTLYIIDSGIRFDHVDFGGRAVSGIDEINPGGDASDCLGHGTHVAGIAGGSTYGVAKNVHLVSVRVIDCNDQGSEATIISGIDWVTGQKNANPSVPSVANMSLHVGSISSAVNAAVQGSIQAGVVYAVAAGNDDANACNDSPSSAPDAITVGATNSSDAFASFSNSGPCMDLSAPGVSITSDYNRSATDTQILDGTSMAAPHVAGAAALYLQSNPTATTAQVTEALLDHATTGRITGLPASTPNSLLYAAFAHTVTQQPYLEGPVDVYQSSNCHLMYTIHNATRSSDWQTDGTVLAYDADWIQLTFPTPGGHYVLVDVQSADGGTVTLELDPVASLDGTDCN